MRIAFVANNTYAAWGGSEELWSLAALRLARGGVPVLACVQNWQPPPPRIAELRAAGVAIHVIRPHRAARLREGLRSRLRSAPPRDLPQITVDEAVVPFRPDLVVISQMMNTDGALWARACRSRGLPYALIAQAAAEFVWPEDWQFSEARAAHEHAHRSFFVSRHNLALTERQLGLALPHGEIVRNPFQVAPDQPATWPADERVFHLACVARLEPAAKGQDLLLQVLALPRWRSRPLAVSLYGAGRQSLSLPALTAHFGLRQTVRFGGHTGDITGIWHTHHALVLPSRLEGLPLALVEAMFCHRPVIVTDAGGNAELVEDNLSGFVAATPTVAALDEALERAWARRAEWRELGLAAGRRVRELVPSDPAGVFAQRLLTVAAEKP
jgi:glycosyltransferase involved in cell wall biosynthesis